MLMGIPFEMPLALLAFLFAKEPLQNYIEGIVKKLAYILYHPAS